MANLNTANVNPKSFPKTAFDPLHKAALTLAASGKYRILRALEPQTVYGDANGRKLYRGLAIDTETTGLDVEEDVLTEIALVPFTYTDDGEIIEVLVKEIYHGFQDPCRPLSEEVIRLSRHNNETLRGKRFDVEAIKALVNSCDLLVAHHCDFDRRMLERLSAVFASKVWACSLKQVPWAAEGLSSGKLEQILMAAGLFYEAHQALTDVLALIHLLAMPLPKSERMPLAVMRAELRRPLYAVWLHNTPATINPTFKRMGFRWGSTAADRKGFVRLCDEVRVRAVLAEVKEAYQVARLKGEPYVALINVGDLFTDRCAPQNVQWPAPLPIPV